MTERGPYSLGQLALYFLKLGSIGFGGPVALVGYMYRDLVEKRHWITDEDYKEGLTLAQLMPGPLAAQLAMYLGYVHYRVVGATVAGIAFVLPSFLALGWAYAQFGGLSWMQAVFFAALGTFLPCYLFTVLPAPYFKKYGKLPAVKAFVDGITAAAVGAITGSVLVIAKRSLIDMPTVALAVATVLLLWRFKKLQEPVIVVAAALFGLVVYPLIHAHAI